MNLGTAPQCHPRGSRDCNDHVAMISTILCDLDGVVWLAHRPIEGATEAIAALQAAGRRVLFVTNNSAATVATQEAALAAIGVDATGSVVSLGDGRGTAGRAGRAGAGRRRARPRRGDARPRRRGRRERRHARRAAIEAAPFDAVVTGLHRDFDYARLRSAAAAVHRGARLIGTNADPTYPTPTGLDPGGGSILAAIATAGLRRADRGGQATPADGVV